jgi:hypothetical protein
MPVFSYPVDRTKHWHRTEMLDTDTRRSASMDKLLGGGDGAHTCHILDIHSAICREHSQDRQMSSS